MAKMMTFYLFIYIKKQLGLIWVYLGHTSPRSTLRVDRVLPGQILGWFFLKPDPIPALGQPGPRSTRRARPGFKTMLSTYMFELYLTGL